MARPPRERYAPPRMRPPPPETGHAELVPAKPGAAKLVIDAGSHDRDYWRELWARRGLVLDMAWRDIQVKYKQTYLGLSWAVIQPFIAIVVFTFVFGRLAKLPSVGDVPYPLLVFAGLIPWQLFANSLSSISNSMVANAHLVQRVYFPRLVLPLQSILVAGFNTLISLALFLIVLLAYGEPITWRVLALPGFLLLAALTAFAIGVWIAALNVRYRDFRYLVPYLLQMAMYLSPVGFKSGVVGDSWQFIYNLNPMVGVIEGCRWALLGGAAPVDVLALGVSMTGTLLLALGGVWFFRRFEGTFADRI